MRDSTFSIVDSIVLMTGLVVLILLQKLTLFLANYLFGYDGACIMGMLHLCAIELMLHVLNKGESPKD